MKRVIVSLFVLTVAIVVSGVCFAEEREKSSWYIGFGIGSGDGNAEDNEVFENADSTGPTVTLNFGVGAILTPKIHLGFEASAWRREAQYDTYSGTDDYAMQINNYLAAVTIFPFDKGLALKGGFGAAIAVHDYEDSSESYIGTAYLVGAGYHLWLGRTFNLGINFDYSRQRYNDEDFYDDTDFYSAYVSFYWF